MDVHVDKCMASPLGTLVVFVVRQRSARGGSVCSQRHVLSPLSCLFFRSRPPRLCCLCEADTRFDLGEPLVEQVSREKGLHNQDRGRVVVIGGRASQCRYAEGIGGCVGGQPVKSLRGEDFWLHRVCEEEIVQRSIEGGCVSGHGHSRVGASGEGGPGAPQR